MATSGYDPRRGTGNYNGGYQSSGDAAAGPNPLQEYMDLVSAGALPAGKYSLGNVLMTPELRAQVEGAGTPGGTSGGTQQMNLLEALKAGPGAVRKGAYGEATGVDYGSLSSLLDGLSPNDAVNAGNLALSSANQAAAFADKAAALKILLGLSDDITGSSEMKALQGDITTAQGEIRAGKYLPDDTVDRTAIDAWAERELQRLGETAAASGMKGAPDVRQERMGINATRATAINQAFNALKEKRREAGISEQNRLVGLGQTAVAAKTEPAMTLAQAAASGLNNTQYGQPMIVNYGAGSSGGGSASGTNLGGSVQVLADNSPTFQTPFDAGFKAETGNFKSQFQSTAKQKVQVGVNPQTGQPIYEERTVTNYNPSETNRGLGASVTPR